MIGGSLKNHLVWLLGIWITLLNAAASSLDTTFDIGTGANGIVEQVLPLADGRILICGNFTTFNGRNHAYIARLNSNGSLDESFYGQASYWVRNMSVQADGKIVIGGYFKGVQGVSRSLVARLNTDGSLDTSFDPGTGATESIGTAIDGNPDPFVFWTAVQPDGKILITGNFRYYNGASSPGFARINPDGSRDTSFNVGSGLDSWGRSIRLQSNGQIVLSGWFQNYNGHGFNRLVRINSDGSPDLSFNAYFGDSTSCYSTADAGGGKMIVCGHSINTQGLFTREVKRLNADGSDDSAWVGFTNEKTERVIVQPDGKAIVVGYFNAANNQPRTSLARFNPDGSLDNTLQANIDNYAWSAALQSDGKLLISGGFYTVDGVSRAGVARFNTGLSSGGGGTPPPPSPAPVLSATANSSSQITLTWTDSATDHTGYSLERKTGAGGTYAAIATLASSARSYVNTGLAAGTQYFYRLRATTTAGGSVYSNEASATTTGAATGGSSTATFVGSDANTHGTWKGIYGADGYAVFSDTTSYPAYARVTPLNKSDWTWQYSTTDTDALQKASSSSDRIAACWYSSGTFSIDVAITDGQKHRVSLYLLDWDVSGRNETVQVIDGDSGAILGSQNVTSFSGGVYLTWDVVGHVKFNISSTTVNGVVSGIFFGGAGASGGGGGTTQTAATPTISPNGGSYTSAQSVTLATSTSGAQIRYTLDGTDPTSTSALYSAPFSVSSSATVKAKAFASGMNASATASATFTISTGGGGGTTGGQFVYIGSDTTTKGNWRGVYGADGYNVLGSSFKYPTYLQLTPIGKSDWVWNNTTTDARALSTADGTSREAGCWYSSGGFAIDLRITDGATHRLAIYLCDWDFANRSETVELLNGDTGAVLQSQTISGFSGGQYLVWDFKGHVQLRFTRLAGPNAIVNGLFFQPAARQL
jgi:uncharacterized delta-60 repeat protein